MAGMVIARVVHSESLAGTQKGGWLFFDVKALEGAKMLFADSKDKKPRHAQVFDSSGREHWIDIETIAEFDADAFWVLDRCQRVQKIADAQKRDLMIIIVSSSRGVEWRVVPYRKAETLRKGWNNKNGSRYFYVAFGEEEWLRFDKDDRENEPDYSLPFSINQIEIITRL